MRQEWDIADFSRTSLWHCISETMEFFFSASPVSFNKELSFASIGASCSPLLCKGLDGAINGATAAADASLQYSATTRPELEAEDDASGVE